MPLYTMVQHGYFRLSGHMPDVPRPFYVGRGVTRNPKCDSRTNPQDPMPGHAVVKISLSPGGLACGGPGLRPVKMRRGTAILREIGETGVWDACDPQHAGRPWEYLGLIFAGASALTTARGIARRHGRLYHFDPDGLIVRRLLALAREPTHTIRLTAGEGMQLVQDVLLHLATSAEAALTRAPRPRLAAGVEEVMSRELDRNHTVGELAAMYDVSREHLTRAFTQEYGVSPRQYARQIKMREACRQLRQGDAAVKQIMRSVGFTSRTSFNRAFRDAVGSTPVEFRRGKTRASPLT